MLSPMNAIDFQRFKKLTDAIYKYKHLRSQLSPGTTPEISIYVSDGAEKIAYVSLEIKGYIPSEDVQRIFDDLDLNVIKV